MPSPSPDIAPGWLASVVVVGLMVLTSGIWFASSWVDDPPDSSCGSVFHAELGTPECERVIPIRLGVTGVLLALGAGVILAAAAKPSWRRGISVVAIGSLCVAIGTVIVNEFLRSGGLWTAG